MGRPVGMGSVKIEPQLFTCDRKSRYGSLFKNGEFHTALERKEITGFVKVFEQYILNILPKGEQGEGKKENEGKEDEASLWQTPRLKELKIMLNWSNTKEPRWLERTRYMSVQNREYRDRKILPGPKEVVNPETK